MALTNQRRPLRFLRKDSSNAAMAGNASVDSSAPSYGWTVVTIFLNITAAGTLVIQQRLRANSTYVTTDPFVLAGAGSVRTAVQITGEHVKAIFTDTSGLPQTPEMIIGMA